MLAFVYLSIDLALVAYETRVLTGQVGENNLKAV
jgi:hypothetical protein